MQSESGLTPAREWMAHFAEIQLSGISADNLFPLHITAIAVPVTNQDRARAFYIDSLGFQRVTIAPLTASVDLAAAAWRIVRGWIGTRHVCGRMDGVSLLTRDLDELCGRWMSAGVAFEGPPTLQTWGARAAIFADVDRNRFQLVEPAGDPPPRAMDRVRCSFRLRALRRFSHVDVFGNSLPQQSAPTASAGLVYALRATSRD